MSKRTLYFGPMRGIYNSSRFDKFVKREVAERIGQLGLSNTCNPEEGKKTTIYHFPQAGMGVEHIVVNEHRCMVNLLGEHPDHLDAITLLFFQKDQE